MEHNHEVWMVCPVCGEEYDGRMGGCCLILPIAPDGYRDGMERGDVAASNVASSGVYSLFVPFIGMGENVDFELNDCASGRMGWMDAYMMRLNGANATGVS